MWDAVSTGTLRKPWNKLLLGVDEDEVRLAEEQQLPGGLIGIRDAWSHITFVG